jgi:hypothetical protein
MRPPRSLPAVLGLTALLAAPAIADAATAPVRAVGFQAKVISVSKKTSTLRARVLTASGTGLSKYKGKTLTFNAKKARMTVPDTNGDKKANTLGDIKRNDIVGVIGTAPVGAFKVVTVSTLTDVTALLPKQTPPTTPIPPGILPSGTPISPGGQKTT